MRFPDTLIVVTEFYNYDMKEDSADDEVCKEEFDNLEDSDKHSLVVLEHPRIIFMQTQQSIASDNGLDA